MLRIINIVLAIIALLSAWYLFSFSQNLTTRAIHSVTSEYIIPYGTHGGVVYISQREHEILTYGWILTVLLIIFQLILNYLNSRKKRY